MPPFNVGDSVVFIYDQKREMTICAMGLRLAICSWMEKRVFGFWERREGAFAITSLVPITNRPNQRSQVMDPKCETKEAVKGSPTKRGTYWPDREPKVPILFAPEILIGVGHQVIHRSDPEPAQIMQVVWADNQFVCCRWDTSGVPGCFPLLGYSGHCRLFRHDELMGELFPLPDRDLCERGAKLPFTETKLDGFSVGRGGPTQVFPPNPCGPKAPAADPADFTTPYTKPVSLEVAPSTGPYLLVGRGAPSRRAAIQAAIQELRTGGSTVIQSDEEIAVLTLPVAPESARGDTACPKMAEAWRPGPGVEGTPPGWPSGGHVEPPPGGWPADGDERPKPSPLKDVQELNRLFGDLKLPPIRTYSFAPDLTNVALRIVVALGPLSREGATEPGCELFDRAIDHLRTLFPAAQAPK